MNRHERDFIESACGAIVLGAFIFFLMSLPC